MFTQFHNPQSLHGELLDFYLSNGWFRSGQYIYTTKILNFDGKLYSPIRIRLPLEGYEFRKSLRKIWNKNQQFSTVFRKAFISREKEELYQKVMRAIQLIEDGAPHMAKRLLEELANEVTFMK